MVISTGLKILGSFLYRKHINHIHLLNFLYLPSLVWDLPLAWLVFCNIAVFVLGLYSTCEGKHAASGFLNLTFHLRWSFHISWCSLVSAYLQITKFILLYDWIKFHCIEYHIFSTHSSIVTICLYSEVFWDPDVPACFVLSWTHWLFLGNVCQLLRERITRPVTLKL
jgi:hypothetical protein